MNAWSILVDLLNPIFVMFSLLYVQLPDFSQVSQLLSESKAASSWSAIKLSITFCSRETSALFYVRLFFSYVFPFNKTNFIYENNQNYTSSKHLQVNLEVLKRHVLYQKLETQKTRTKKLSSIKQIRIKNYSII